MYWSDHFPPHFHAEYAGADIAVAIGNGAIVSGAVPARALRLIREWAVEHHQELLDNWERARHRETLHRIEPLP